MKRIVFIVGFCISNLSFAQKPATNNLRPSFSKAIAGVVPAVVLVRSLATHNEPSPHIDVVRTGTGVIVSKDGFIITNAHVVTNDRNQKLEQVEALVNKKKYYSARIVGIDREKDLALIKIDVPLSEGELATVKFQTEPLVLGQDVLKVGFPGAVSSENPTLAHGIVTNTRVFLGNFSTPYGATDTNLSAGDSGGPLFDVTGKVIGIDTAVKNGVGHFITTKAVLRVLPRLYRGNVRTGWLGINPEHCVNARNINQDDLLKARASEFLKAQGIKLPELDRGVVIMRIGNPEIGDAKFFQPGDAVVRMDGRIPRDTQEFVQWIAEIEPGSEVLFEIVRDGTRALTRLRVGEFDWNVQAHIHLPPKPEESKENKH